MKQIVGCLCVFMLLLFANAATTWYVASSGNDSNTGKTQAAALKTIQKAIDKSAAGDTILVSKGTYSYIIVPADKEPLTIRATGSVSDCVIKGDTSKHMRCATLGTESTTNIVLEGFTLTGGKVNEYCDDRRGAGVAYGTANNCVITGNTSGSLSTAAGAYGCTLNSCTISSNTATDWAGGMESCIANDCIIKDNTGNHGAGGAGACILTRCTISKNVSSLGGGGADGCVLYDCYLESNKGYWGSELNGGTAYNCVICANGGSRVATGARCYNCTIYSTLSGQHIWRDTFLYNCIISGEGGTFSVDGDTNWKVNLYNCFLHNVTVGKDTTQSSCFTGDPKFISGSNRRLQSSSPCINKGNNSYALTDTDYDGNPRISKAKVDIGAFEYQFPIAKVGFVEAHPRYPWNGMIDLKFAIEGESGVMFNATFSAKDLAGGTNLTVKTLYKSDGSAANVAKEQLLPGTYNYVWDATADLGAGVVLDRVVVEVAAE